MDPARRGKKRKKEGTGKNKSRLTNPDIEASKREKLWRKGGEKKK